MNDVQTHLHIGIDDGPVGGRDRGCQRHQLAGRGMNDVCVHACRWAPVSAGEYDRRSRTISVNLTVVEAVETRYGHAPDLVTAAILAHERVHVEATGEALPHEEERQARAAAVRAAGLDVVAHIEDVLAEAWG